MDLKEKLIDVHICPSRKTDSHTHAYLELAYVIEGKAVHIINDAGEEIISQGDYFIIDYNTSHSYKSVGDEDFVVINCLFLPKLVDKSLNYCRDFRTLLRHYMIQIDSDNTHLNIENHIFHDDGRVLDILYMMLDEEEKKRLGMTEMLRLMLIEILILTARKVEKAQSGDIIFKIIRRIHEDYNKDITLGDISADLNYSLPYISKLFKERTGMTFRRYLQKTRIDEACRLLTNTTEKVSVISRMVGYMDVDFFCRMFKAQTGMTPGNFRSII